MGSNSRKFSRFGISALLVLFVVVRLLSWLRRFQVFGDAYAYYIPAAVAYVKGALPNTINFEHPPLAKYIIGAFALYLGSPNFSSLLFGALAVSAALGLARKLISVGQSAWIVIWLLTFDQINITISIDPMLDVFMLAFALIGIYLVVDREETTRFALAGLCFGLAMASKWVALFLLIPALLFIILQRHYLGAGVMLTVAVTAYTVAYLPLIARQGLPAYLGLQLQMFSYMLSQHGATYGILPVVNRLIGPFIFISSNAPLYRLWQSHLFGNYFISLDEGVNPFISYLTFPVLYFQIRKSRSNNPTRVRAQLLLAMGFFFAWYVLFADPVATWHYAPIDALAAILATDLLREPNRYDFLRRLLFYAYLGALALWPLLATLIVT